MSIFIIELQVNWQNLQEFSLKKEMQESSFSLFFLEVKF